MSTIMFPQKDLREETAALRAQILDRLSKLPWDGLSFAHPVPGLSLYRIVEPAGPFFERIRAEPLLHHQGQQECPRRQRDARLR
ncbi:hypothetical protein Q1M64_14275 (plasmid) [Sinorhizobium meliloti]|nr:hypothetical protein Q1M64_14275 [Sinorhizobium meliloti]